MLKAALFSIAMVTALGVAAPVHADTLSVGDVVKFSPGPAPQAAGGGGPFLITGPSDAWVTFCLEFNEYMNYGGNFYVGGISNSAISGGTGGSLGADPAYPTDVRDPLSVKTQAVYHKYRTDNDLGWTGDVVQWAIWIFEQEKPNDPANAIVTWANANAAGYDFGGDAVKAINLYSDRAYTAKAQDQLMIVPGTERDVPEPASLLLLGSTLSAFALRRRRTSKRQA